jgi:hypothetical protein
MRAPGRVAKLGALSLAWMAGCVTASGTLETSRCQELATTFFRQPFETRISDFTRRELPDQYTIFICGNQFMHPPAQYLAEPFARRGGEIVPFLRRKLAEAQDDLTVRDIVLVFSEMGRQRSYDVSKNVDLIREMRVAAARMKNQDWRTITEQRIEAATSVR